MVDGGGGGGGDVGGSSVWASGDCGGDDVDNGDDAMAAAM